MKTSLYPFEDLFESAPDGIPIVKRTLLIRGLPLLPGSRCRPGFRFAGIDISEHVDQPIVVFDRIDHLDFLGFVSYERDKENKNWVKDGVLLTATPTCCTDFFRQRNKQRNISRNAELGSQRSTDPNGLALMMILLPIERRCFV